MSKVNAEDFKNAKAASEEEWAVRVDLVGSLGGCICARKPWWRAVIPEVVHQAVVFAQRRVSYSEIRVDIDGSTEVLLGKLELSKLETPAEAEAVEVSLVGVQALCRTGIERPDFFRVNCNADVVHNCVRDC